MLKYRIIQKVVLHDSLDYDQAKYAFENMKDEKEELHISLGRNLKNHVIPLSL